MNKNLFIIFIFLISFPVYATNIDELNEPKDFSGRLSNTDKVETKKQINVEKKEPELLPKYENKEQIEQIEKTYTGSNYADLSLKRLADDISFEIEEDQAKINSDLAILWQSAMSRSETMKYTIYKLSNPEEDKPDETRLKKILKPIANFSSIAGASVAGNPFVATSALVGGGLVNAFMKDDKETNYRFSKVSDADMVLLVRKIDDLQKKLLELYVDYKTKEQLLKMTEDNFIKREEIYKNSQNKTKEELTIIDVSYRNSKVSFEQAKDDYETSRAILENLVGNDALKAIEEK